MLDRINRSLPEEPGEEDLYFQYEFSQDILPKIPNQDTRMTLTNIANTFSPFATITVRKDDENKIGFLFTESQEKQSNNLSRKKLFGLF